MRIAFFGASVTEQKSGYARQFAAMVPGHRVEVHGYGSQHITDAGVCYIDRVCEGGPDYCFLDWFVTGIKDVDKAMVAIDTIALKLSRIGCRVVFLFLLARSANLSGAPFYERVKRHLRERGLAWLDMNDHLEFSDRLIRDDVHTTLAGSVAYASLIHEFWMSENIHPPQDIPETRLMDIKVLPVRREVTDTLELRASEDCEIITMKIEIGPHSGLVDINGRVESTWDRWCYYSRKVCRCYPSMRGTDIRLRVIEAGKKLIIEDIFYIGSSLVVHTTPRYESTDEDLQWWLI